MQPKACPLSPEIIPGCGIGRFADGGWEAWFCCLTVYKKYMVRLKHAPGARKNEETDKRITWPGVRNIENCPIELLVCFC